VDVGLEKDLNGLWLEPPNEKVLADEEPKPPPDDEPKPPEDDFDEAATAANPPAEALTDPKVVDPNVEDPKVDDPNPVEGFDSDFGGVVVPAPMVDVWPNADPPIFEV